MFSVHSVVYRQLHMHVISTDFNSDALKNKKHWNSFTTSFFIDANEFISILETQGAVKVERIREREREFLPLISPKFDKHKFESMLTDELRCPICSAAFPTIPKVKLHYQSCLSKK
jgi:aprataxin